jgi:hypothetical protein
MRLKKRLAIDSPCTLPSVLARADVVQPPGDVVQRLVPRRRLEAPLALGAHAPQRRRQPVRMIGALDVAVHLGAQEPLRHRVVGVALHAYGAAVLHVHQHGARVGAVVRAGAAHDAGLDKGKDRRGHAENDNAGFAACRGSGC